MALRAPKSDVDGGVEGGLQPARGFSLASAQQDCEVPRGLKKSALQAHGFRDTVLKEGHP